MWLEVVFIILGIILLCASFGAIVAYFTNSSVAAWLPYIFLVIGVGCIGFGVFRTESQLLGNAEKLLSKFENSNINIQPTPTTQLIYFSQLSPAQNPAQTIYQFQV